MRKIYGKQVIRNKQHHPTIHVSSNCYPNTSEQKNKKKKIGIGQPHTFPVNRYVLKLRKFRTLKTNLTILAVTSIKTALTFESRSNC